MTATFPSHALHTPMDQPLLRSLVGLPARLNVEQTATVLGFQPHDVPVLVAAGLLTPLGRAIKGKNAVKYFALVDILAKRNDPKWLSTATDAVYARFAGRRVRPESLPVE
jgi:hypothetical protein